MKSSSSNYDQTFANEDGSWAIITPRFASPQDKNMRLSNGSDITAVCKKFGFTRYVDNSLVTVAGDSEMVRLDNTGHFAQYDSGNSFYAIGELFCTTDPASYPRSKSIEKNNLDDDGSHWISGLSMKFDNHQIKMSSENSFDVVCDRFGFGPFVKNSVKTELLKADEPSVVLYPDGRFQKYVRPHYNRDAYFIKELICRPHH